MTDRRLVQILSFAILLTLSLIAPVTRAAAPGEVDKAIDKAKAYLYAQQKNGTWEIAAEGDMSPKGRHRGGLTALVTYALVASGENPQDPRLLKALDFLKTADIPSAYALGCRAQLWNLLPPSKEVRRLAQADAERLIKQIKGAGDARGLFHYPETPPDSYDMSVSQYGVLGLWACENAGAEIRSAVWEEMDRAWRAHQFKDGGWNYRNNPGEASENGESPSMTAAGIATLFITHDAVRAKEYLGCAGNKQDDNITRGLDWMTRNFNQVFTGGARGPSVVHYTLYGIERIGVAAGYKYFGKTDWFAAGSDFLLKSQAPTGAWGTPADIFSNNIDNIPTTCFSLLFLARGRSPVIINKLHYEPGNKTVKPSWNQRPRDCANLTAWLGRSLERPLNWQITNLDAPVDELLDAPVLYITGTHDLTFTPEQENKLRQFAEDGGLILGNADCNSPAFTAAFTKLGQRLFPASEFRELPDDHPIYVNEQYHRAAFKNKPALQGLSNGSRELLILQTTDPSRTWQTPYDGRLEPYALGADILLYAVDKKGLRNRNVTYTIRANPAAPIERSLKLARLSYPGNWDPEPGGWRRMAALLRNQNKVDLQITPVALGEGKLCEPPPPVPKLDPKELRTRATKRIPPDQIAAAVAAGETAKIESLVQAESQKIEQELTAQAVAGRGKNSAYAVAHLTGTSRNTFTPAQIKELADFINGGGTLLIDCTGGSTEFADSLQAVLAALPGGADALKSPLPADHPLVKELAGKDLYRAYAKPRLGSTRSPRLRAGGGTPERPALFYSPEDLSTGLVGQEVDGIIGYAPDAATALVRQILLRASGN
ncbi:MAG: hypothetical protein JWN40_1779 [Phycisphaerales bacterium]|nr:hypothetical protein [Phycisphaerales bacterium]